MSSLSWLPNWEDVSQYPNLDDTDSLQWAWEFLRRNSKYQEDWIYELSLIGKHEAVSPDHPDFEIIPGQEDDSKGRRYYLNAYGIYTLPNPANPNPLHLTFDPYYGDMHVQHGNDFDPVNIPLLKNQAAIIFDLSQSIPEQIDKAKKRLKEYLHDNEISTTKMQNRQKEWRIYLRLLDAEEENVSKQDMASLIFPEQKNNKDHVKKCLRRAKEIRDYLYRNIPLGVINLPIR